MNKEMNNREKIVNEVCRQAERFMVCHENLK